MNCLPDMVNGEKLDINSQKHDIMYFTRRAMFSTNNNKTQNINKYVRTLFKVFTIVFIHYQKLTLTF